MLVGELEIREATLAPLLYLGPMPREVDRSLLSRLQPPDLGLLPLEALRDPWQVGQQKSRRDDRVVARLLADNHRHRGLLYHRHDFRHPEHVVIVSHESIEAELGQRQYDLPIIEASRQAWVDLAQPTELELQHPALDRVQQDGFREVVVEDEDRSIRRRAG